MRVLVIVSVLATIVINGLANALPFNDLTTGEISNRFQVLFTPAAYVFAIWGLIYLGLIALAVFQALPSQASNPRLRDARGWMAASGIFNIAWLLLWHYEQFPLSMLAMTGLLLTLIVAYLRLDVGKVVVSTGERWFIQLPLGIYLGWISVATIANAAVVLDFLGWRGGGISPEAWTLIMIAVALVVGWILALQRADIAVAGVLVWAFVGIAVRNAELASVASGAWLAAALAATAIMAGVWRSRLTRSVS